MNHHRDVILYEGILSLENKCTLLEGNERSLTSSKQVQNFTYQIDTDRLEQGDTVIYKVIDDTKGTAEPHKMYCR